MTIEDNAGGSVDPETAQAHDTIEQVVGILAALLGRPSRWTGDFQLTDNPFSSGVAHLDGRMEITRAIWHQPQYRWRTAIHESLHMFSPAYTRLEYSQARGWEEGVVEQMQRLLRQEVLDRIGVELSEDVFAERDAGHEYNRYILALETLRPILAIEVFDYYNWLLAMPLAQRLTAVRDRGDLLPEMERRAFRRALLLAQGVLGRM